MPSRYVGTESISISGVTGGSQQLTVLEAEVSLTGNGWQKHPIVTGPEAPCILGIDYLRNGYFKDLKEYRWAFGIAAVETEDIRQLSTLPGLSDDSCAVGLLKVEEQQVPIATTTVHRRQYRTDRDSVTPIHEMIRKLESQGVVSKARSPFNSPIWPVRKSSGEWRLTVDYRALNEVTPPLSAAVPDMLELQYELESKAAKWYATIDIANAFFSIPLAAECRAQFAFTWKGVQYTWNRLPQGWKHSPTICHGLIQTALEKGEAPEHLQYIDDIIVWGNTAGEVFEKGEKIIQILLKAGFAIKRSKVKGPAQEIQFLGVKWQDGRRQIPTEVINKIIAMSPPTSKKETQAFLGAIGFWRMHIPEYRQIVSPLYLVTRKKNDFHWGPEQQQAFAQIKQEIAHAVALGPVRTGPEVKNVLYSAAGNNGLSWSLWQKVPGETRGRPLGFWSRSYRGSEANYTPTEKEILAAYEGLQAASEVIGTETQLLLAPRLPVLGWMFKGKVPSTHHATDTTWSKWIALITQRARIGNPNRPGILEIITNWPEGETFGLSFEEEEEQVTRAEEAPPYNELPETERQYALFTDGSCRIVGANRKWKAAVWSPTRRVAQATEGQGGSSQIAELKAIQLALDIAEREKWPRLYLYTDSWMVANALWGWLNRWKKANWQRRGKPIWAAEIWQDIAARVEKLTVKVRHVDAHVSKSQANEEHHNNEQVDKAAKVKVSQVDLDWQHKGEVFLARWAHDASGHQGRDATYRWARDRGVDLTMDNISQVIHNCETCAAIKQAKRVKPLWYGGRWLKYRYGEAWQIDYITLPQTRQGKRYVLTRVEATTGWLETYPVPHATARNTILGLEKQVLWRHGTPERIESDNGTHFKNGLINTWAREHGIEWIYHIPYHAPAAGKVERCNGLLKTTLKALGGGTFKNWELNLAKATWMVNTRGSINRAGPAQSEPLHTVDGDKVPVVHMKGILRKTVWINPTSSKGRPIRGIVFAQGPGSTWWFAAYWAGELSPLERGDPLAIISGPDQLLENIHKAACLQMIHERTLISGYESPEELPVKPELMAPLIRGLPEPLKPTAITLQKTTMALGPVERLDRFLGNPSNQTGSTDPGFAPYSIPSQLPASQSDSSAGDHKVRTESQLAADLINYSKKYGPVKTPEDTSTRLSQGYKHSLTLAQDAQELENIPIGHNVAVYQYIDDILVGGDEIEEVGDVQQKIISHLESLNLQVTSEKIQKPSQEVKLLGIWWKGAMTCIPPDTLTSLDQIKMPESRKDLQQALGLLVFWRKHIPDFSIIARPLYDLLRKRVKWDWTPAQEEALQLLIFEATAHQALGAIHPTDPFQVEWGFASSGLSIHIWQQGSERSMKSAGFYSHSFKDAEKRYTTWEKGLFVVSLALIEVEKVAQQQPIVLRGPSEVIKTVTTGTPPPDGVAQGTSVRKWYAQIEHYCNIFSITEEAVKGVNDKWVVNGCHKITAFCPTPPSIIPSPQGPDDPKHPAHYPGQPALVDLPAVGAVPLVLKIPLNNFACIVFDALGKEHQKNYMLDNSIILIFCLLVADLVVFAFHRRTPRDIQDHLNHDKTSDTFLSVNKPSRPPLVRADRDRPGVAVSTVAMMLEEALFSRKGTISVIHVNSHNPVKGFFQIGNDKADAAAKGLWTLRDAHQLHESLHIGAKALVKKCGISTADAKHAMATCPHCQKSPLWSSRVNPRGLKASEIWQTDFTLCQLLKPQAWLAVTVDTYSGVIVATQHPKTDSKATIQHCLTAMVWLGIPKQIKTDNGPNFVSKSTQAFVAKWGITLVHGIPYNSTGQAIVERANQTLKAKLEVLAKTEGFTSSIPSGDQARILATALLALNQFSRGDEKTSPAQKHWATRALEEGPHVIVKNELGEWEQGWRLVLAGRGYAAVKKDGKVKWCPLKSIKPDLQNRTNEIMRSHLQDWIIGRPHDAYTQVPEENDEPPSNPATPKDPTPVRSKQLRCLCVILVLDLVGRGQANVVYYPHQPFRWVLRHLSSDEAIKEIITVDSPSFEFKLTDIFPSQLGFPKIGDSSLYQTYWCPASNPGKSYCSHPKYGYCGYWGCETIVTSDRWQPQQPDKFLQVRVLYHQEEEMYRFLEETIQLHKREVMTGITIAMLLGLGATGTATGVSALMTQHQRLSQLQMTIDEDLLRIEKSISSLERSISSLSEVVLQNR
ncbi:hypothetical protein DUI87_20772 [Hirundo rustica rustica]|uniref:Uncharacterized protein n=1 Tax=Hirundo rustica rustica TaxID=333673 RepID=A0A3M0K683_HIRRU|nr:hypothetical protein DUI87_20772 [Hirundo rustica rustica]